LTAPYVYQPFSLEIIRLCLDQALNELKLPFDQALGYTTVECSLSVGDPIWLALKFTALATVALEFNYLQTFESQLGLSDPLSRDLRQYCSDDVVVSAADALKDEGERQTFMRDIQKARRALRIG
jgi:hypothetical protein